MWDAIEALLERQEATGVDSAVAPCTSADAVPGEELLRGRAVLDRLEACWLAQLAAFDAAGDFAADGAVSTVAWLRQQARLSHAAASRAVKRARQLRQLPVTAALVGAGELSAGQLDAILANVSTQLTSLFAQAEAELVPTLAALPVRDVARLMRHWAAHAEAVLQQQQPPAEHDRQLFLTRLLNDRLQLQGHIDDPVAAATVEHALALARSQDVEQPLPQRNADALVSICRFFLDNHDKPSGRRHRPHVVIAFDAERGVAEALAGHRIDPLGLETLLCDAAIQRLVRAGPIPLDLGTTTYTVGVQLWQAVALRDRGCRFPGCDRPVSWCDCHHVVRYPEGPTSIDNLAMLCAHHHRLLHQPGWHAKLLPDATLVVTAPGGRALTSSPPPIPPKRE
ncbi:MAG TPA: DUF222 domain-containing protein [Acidimicrobiales bacterium]